MNPQRAGRRGGDSGKESAQDGCNKDPRIIGLVGKMVEEPRLESESQDDAGQAGRNPERDFERPSRVVYRPQRGHERPAGPFRAVACLDAFVLGQVSPGRLRRAIVNCPKPAREAVAPTRKSPPFTPISSETRHRASRRSDGEFSNYAG